MTLRDFYNDGTGAKLALWCGQAYFTSDSGRTFCLSVQFDSRMGDVYSMTCALYGNVREDIRASAFAPFLSANGYKESLSEQATLTPTAKGFSGTLLLPDGLKVRIVYDINEQYTVAFTR